MSIFSQQHSKISTFYLLTRENQQMKAELRQQGRNKKAVLIIPVLATEFTMPENRPVFERIVHQIKDATYLSKIIFGLDGATTGEAEQLERILHHYNLKNYLIQHNDGKDFASFYHTLSEAGFGFDEPGKGRNMFLSFGIALALGANSVGVIDADIRTFRRNQLDRLFYPVQVLNYEFSKAFYARLKNGQLYGRVKRLLLDPLLIALKRKLTEAREEKVLRLVDFLLNFKYQLSGEVVFDTRLLKRIQVATNWGVEIFTLIEVYRKASHIAEVEISWEPFDHKHQSVSEQVPCAGLHRMGTDIVTTLLNALVIEEGLDISESFIRDLTLTYLDVADELIKKYADNAMFCGLAYDQDREEAMVDNVFKHVILHAGDVLLSPSHLVDRFITHVTAHNEFQPFIASGLLAAITASKQSLKDSIYETPKTVSWERVLRKLPNMLDDLRTVVT